ncbi:MULTISPECIES: hypothetical protein [Nostocales]|uniref:Uncharacterized protein n=3 Tax=Nostocales TaxID=1161 RepID=A0A0C1NDV8_9CYAN|nr:hypothetical protein [Tolypothrix bouteillei]KAF3887003.1 hypothetical protein DA73_0400017070 [Tolypothrix bouteillei VB521301]
MISLSIPHFQCSIPKIRIFTELFQENYVKILIIDNNSVISKDIQQRLFDALFTAKGIGKVTAMELSMSYQIFTHKQGVVMEYFSLLRGTTPAYPYASAWSIIESLGIFKKYKLSIVWDRWDCIAGISLIPREGSNALH